MPAARAIAGSGPFPRSPFFLPLPLGEGRSEGRGTSGGSRRSGPLRPPWAMRRPSPPAPLPGGEGRKIRPSRPRKWVGRSASGGREGVRSWFVLGDPRTCGAGGGVSSRPSGASTRSPPQSHWLRRVAGKTNPVRRGVSRKKRTQFAGEGREEKRTQFVGEPRGKNEPSSSENLAGKNEPSHTRDPGGKNEPSSSGRVAGKNEPSFCRRTAHRDARSCYVHSGPGSVTRLSFRISTGRPVAYPSQFARGCYNLRESRASGRPAGRSV